ncbi:hypothetical protein [Brachymonas sp.]|uniref:hypothetical protein n=1 Tax=Brachymonas sp. TaxID=1936292 RepID=UPI0035B2DE22
MTSIIGISKDLTDSGTGAIVNFHVIEYSCIDQRSDLCTAVVSGYISQAAYSEGKNSISRTSVTIAGTPVRGGDALDWMYAQLCEAVSFSSDGNPALASPTASSTSTIYSGGMTVSA